MAAKILEGDDIIHYEVTQAHFASLIQGIVDMFSILQDVPPLQRLAYLVTAVQKMVQPCIISKDSRRQNEYHEMVLSAAQILTTMQGLPQAETHTPSSKSSKVELMNLIEFNDGRYDFLSNTPHLHLALIFRTTIHSLGDSCCKQNPWGQCLLYLAQLVDPEGVLVSGSSAESLFNSQHFVKEEDITMTEKGADIDVMLINKTIPVYNVARKDTPVSFVFNPEGCHLGYTRVNVIGELEEHFPSLKLELIDGTAYLANQEILSQENIGLLEFLDRIDKMIVENKYSKFDSTVLRSKQGPAFTSQLTHFDSESNVSFNFTHDRDVVPALPSDWPILARNWMLRKPEHWPCTELKSAIAAKGCHVVAVAHAKSPYPTVEWRISFSRAELLLAHSLSPFQRSCYRLFKLLCSAGISPKKVVATYFLKTIFFWLCHETPASLWQECNISLIILALIDKLCSFLSAGFLPNFFIPENNMIDHILLEKMEMALKSISAMRRDPLKTFRELSMKPTYAVSSIPWHLTLKPIIDDAPQFLQHRSVLRIMNILSDSMRYCTLAQYNNYMYSEALGNYNTQADIVEICHTCEYPYRLAFAALNSTELADDIPPAIINGIEFHKYLIGMVVEPQEEAVLIYNLGYVHLVQCQTQVPNFDTWMNPVVDSLAYPWNQVSLKTSDISRSEHLEKARLLMLKARSIVGNHITGHKRYRPLNAEYGIPTFLEMACRLAQTLLLQGKPEEARENLKEVIKHPESDSIWVTFRQYERGLYDLCFIQKFIFGCQVQNPEMPQEPVNDASVTIPPQADICCNQLRFAGRLRLEPICETTCQVFAHYLLALTEMLREKSSDITNLTRDIDMQQLKTSAIDEELKCFMEICQLETEKIEGGLLPVSETLFNDCVVVRKLLKQ